jgi:hypothetical protein
VFWDNLGDSPKRSTPIYADVERKARRNTTPIIPIAVSMRSFPNILTKYVEKTLKCLITPPF